MCPSRLLKSAQLTRASDRAWASALLALSTLAVAGCTTLPPRPPAAGEAAGAVPAAAPCNIWSFLLPTQQQKQALCTCICASPLGQMVNSMLKPASLFSGGLVPTICPGPNRPNPADLAKPADSAEGAAARIKQSEADAKARRAAVRYLGTVDCKRFPEAETALVNALLADTSECVRLEAALALGNGCCCTKQTVKALMQVVSGNTDNEPPEMSERVRSAAAVALEGCLERCGECGQEPPPRPEAPAPPERPSPDGVPPVETIPTQPGVPQARADSLLDQARRVLAEYRASRLLMPYERPSAVGVAWEARVASAELEAQTNRPPDPQPPSVLDDPPLPSSGFPSALLPKDLRVDQPR